MTDENVKRLTIELTFNQHIKIKMQAAEMGLSIKDYILSLTQ